MGFYQSILTSYNFYRNDDRLKRENKRQQEQAKLSEKVLKDLEHSKEKQLERDELKKKEILDHYKHMKNRLEQNELERKEKKLEWKKNEKKSSKKEYNYLISQKRYENEIVLPELEKVS